MGDVTYKNSNDDNVVTLDSSSQDAKRLAKLDNWTKVANPTPVVVVELEKPPAKSAAEAVWRDWARRHASDAEQAAIELLTKEQLIEQYGSTSAVGAVLS